MRSEPRPLVRDFFVGVTLSVEHDDFIVTSGQASAFCTSFLQYLDLSIFAAVVCTFPLQSRRIVFLYLAWYLSYQHSISMHRGSVLPDACSTGEAPHRCWFGWWVAVPEAEGLAVEE